MRTFSTIAEPYRVMAPGAKVHLVIMNATDGLPAAFALMGTRAKKKVAIRISGGCKGMSGEDKVGMLNYFLDAFAGYEGLIWSGASRMIKDGVVDPMVTEVPGAIAAENPDCVALGTVPRTDLLSLQGDSRLVLDEWNVPNPAVSGILIVQNDPCAPGGWDLDLPMMFALMDNWKQYAGFEALGFIGWNGGDITRDEILGGAKRGHHSFVIKGSGRVSDEIAALVEQDDTCGGQIKSGTLRALDKERPQDLRSNLETLGFFG